MSGTATRRGPSAWRRIAVLTGGTVLLLALFLWPDMIRDTFAFIGRSLFVISPLVVPGILLAAWVAASGAGSRVSEAFNGHVAKTVIAASVIGAVTPVCGVTVLPLMAGLLAAGVPLAPVMAFWLSSPITDPAMLATTAATLGIEFALGKTLAAIGLGLFGGFATAAMGSSLWIQLPLRRNSIVGDLGRQSCCGPAGFAGAIWRDADRRRTFRREVVSIARLILICLVPAFAAEYWLNEALQPAALTAYLGQDAWWSVPVAVIVGGPAYLDGYAALPLTRALIEHGMSPGAGMAFLVSGGVVSVWGAMAIFPVLNARPFLLYLALAVSGSMICGWLFDWLA